LILGLGIPNRLQMSKAVVSTMSGWRGTDVLFFVGRWQYIE